MVELKQLFMGPDRQAVMFIPPENEYVNLHEHTHHLWSPVEGRAVPEMVP